MERLTRKSDISDMVWFIDREHKSGYAEREPCEMDSHHSRLAIAKLAEYEDLEEQGKLLKLSCANWMEIVFGNQEIFYGIDMDYMENPIREISVDNSERITWYDGWKTVVLKGADENGLDWEFSPEEVGKSVFLTKEAAESALKELEGKNENTSANV